MPGRVLVDGEVGIGIAVGNYVIPLHRVLMHFAVDVTLLTSRLITDGGENAPVDHVLEVVSPSVVDDATHIPGCFGLMDGRGILGDRVGIARTSINGEVLPSFPRLRLVSLTALHGIHLVFLVVREHLLPTVNLVRTPLHAVHLILHHFLWRNSEVVHIRDILGVLILPYPRDIDGFLSRVHIVHRSHRVGDLCQVRQTLVFPLRNHHVLQLVGSVVEQRGHLLTQ